MAKPNGLDRSGRGGRLLLLLLSLVIIPTARLDRSRTGSADATRPSSSAATGWEEGRILGPELAKTGRAASTAVGAGAGTGRRRTCRPARRGGSGDRNRPRSALAIGRRRAGATAAAAPFPPLGGVGGLGRHLRRRGVVRRGGHDVAGAAHDAVDLHHLGMGRRRGDAPAATTATTSSRWMDRWMMMSCCYRRRRRRRCCLGRLSGPVGRGPLPASAALGRSDAGGISSSSAVAAAAAATLRRKQCRPNIHNDGANVIVGRRSDAGGISSAATAIAPTVARGDDPALLLPDLLYPGRSAAGGGGGGGGRHAGHGTCIVEANQSEQWKPRKIRGPVRKSSQPMRPFELTSNSISTPRKKRYQPHRSNSTELN